MKLFAAQLSRLIDVGTLPPSSRPVQPLNSTTWQLRCSSDQRSTLFSAIYFEPGVGRSPGYYDLAAQFSDCRIKAYWASGRAESTFARARTHRCLSLIRVAVEGQCRCVQNVIFLDQLALVFQLIGQMQRFGQSESYAVHASITQTVS
jgi:hypothetical protein